MSDIDNLKQQAKDLILKDEYEKVFEILKKIVSLDPNDHEMWYYLSIVYFHNQNLDESEKAINKALSLESENPDYIMQSAYLKHQQGYAEKALEMYKKVLELDPDHKGANNMMGMIAVDEERYDDAIRYFEKAIDDEPDADILDAMIESYLNLNELEQAGERLKQYSKFELEDDELEKRNMLLVRYFIEKAMENWTGSSTEEDGEELFFPETMEQAEYSENYLEMAEEVNTSDEYLRGRVELLREVLTTNREKLESGNTTEEENVEELTGKDKEAWQKLEEIFDLWSNENQENGNTYRSPATIGEIKQSERILKEIDQLRPENPNIKERYKELKNVVKETKKSIPDYKKNFIRSLIISVSAIVVILIILQLQGFETPDFNYDPADYVTSVRTPLTYDAFVDGGGKYNTYLKAGEKVKPIGRMGRVWIQVITENGDRGFVSYRDLKGGAKAVIEKDMPLYTNYKRKAFKDSLHAGDKVTITGYLKMNKEKYDDLARVRTESGETGIMPDYNLYVPVKSDVPELNQTYIFPTTLKNIENEVVNSPLKDAEEKYGPASSIIKKGNTKIAYLRHLQVDTGKELYRGVFLTLDADNNVIKYELNKKREKGMLYDLPFAQDIISLEAFGLMSSSFYDGEGFDIPFWDDFKDLSWITSVIGWIIDIIVVLGIALLFFCLPRLLVSPVMLSVSHARIFSNGIVLFLNFLIYLFASYIFFLWVALLMNQIFSPLIFAVPAFLLCWFRYRSNINYNRCPSCHTMNVGLDKGSSFRGRTKEVTWGTYDVYKGQSSTDTTITHHYERRDKKHTKVIDHFTDHRECVRCGYTWGVEREKTVSSGTTHY